MVDPKADEGLEEDKEDIEVENGVFFDQRGAEAAHEQQEFENNSADPEETIEQGRKPAKS